MYCRTCGKPLDNNAQYCIHCGCLPLDGTSYCPNCGTATLDKQVVCIKCGIEFPKPGMTGPMNTNWRGLDKYYVDEFTKIKNSGEQYKGKFNWAAFLFGPLWALTKGLWLPALVDLVLGFMTAGIVFVVYWLIFALRGNYMYYCKFVKNKDIFI